MKALYLEPDEEITSVVDRLQEIDDTDVAIVIPKRAGVLQSIINLKLLRYQAEQQKKRVSIVTTDKTGRNLAAAVGLTVYQKLPEGEVTKKTTPAVKDRSASPIPIRWRKGAKKEPEPADARTDSPTLADIGYKPGGGPKLKKQELAETAPTVKPVADKAKAKEAEVSKAAEQFISKKAEPTQATEPRRPMLKMVRAKLPSVPRISVPKMRVPKRLSPTAKRLGLRGLAIALAVLLLGASTAAAMVLPKADVTVVAKTDPFNVDIPVTFSGKAAGVDANSNTMPAKVIEVTKDGTAQLQATGQRAAGEKAQGDITVVNTLGRSQAMVARTRFQAPDGKIFRTRSAINVPAGDKVTVSVVADEGGEAGNLPAGTRLTIPGLGGGGDVYGQVDTPLTGGTNTPTTEVSASDGDRAKSELAQSIAKTGLDDAKAKLAVSYKLNEQTAVATVLSSSLNPKIGTTASSFTISGTAKVAYFTYQDSELQKIVTEDLKAKVPPGSDLLDEDIGQAFVPSQASADTLTGVIRITAFTAPAISRDQIKRDIAGKSPAEASQILKAAGKVSDVAVKLSPFWVRSVPKSDRKINIHYVNKPNLAPTPTASPTAGLPSPGQ